MTRKVGRCTATRAANKPSVAEPGPLAEQPDTRPPRSKASPLEDRRDHSAANIVPPCREYHRSARESPQTLERTIPQRNLPRGHKWGTPRCPPSHPRRIPPTSKVSIRRATPPERPLRPPHPRPRLHRDHPYLPAQRRARRLKPRLPHISRQRALVRSRLRIAQFSVTVGRVHIGICGASRTLAARREHCQWRDREQQYRPLHRILTG